MRDGEDLLERAGAALPIAQDRFRSRRRKRDRNARTRAANQKSGERFIRIRSRYATQTPFRLAPAGTRR